MRSTCFFLAAFIFVGCDVGTTPSLDNVGDTGPRSKDTATGFDDLDASTIPEDFDGPRGPDDRPLISAFDRPNTNLPDTRASGGDGAQGGPDASTAPPDVPLREVCDDGLDNDLNGRVDDGCPCIPGTTQPCFAGTPSQVGYGPCQRGTQRCEGEVEFGAWSACVGSGTSQREVCDQQDNNCNGIVDEGCMCRAGERRSCYAGAPATRGVGLCRAGEQTCANDDRGVAQWGRCVGEVLPRFDVCDNLDNDCDGRIDENCDCRPGQTRPCYEGPMGTAAVGVCTVGVQRCVPGLFGGSLWSGCERQVLPSSEDCNDRVDNDCNGRVDCNDVRCSASAECRPCMPGGERFTLTTAPADVLFVVDRSGSMISPTLDGSSRWNALVSAVRAVLPPLDASHHMGLIVYPEPDQCAVPAAPAVPIQQPSAMAIAARLAERGPPRTALTPTLAALMVAEQHLRAVSSPRRRFIVLATDGAPNCGSGAAQVIAQIARIRTMMGVDTFVLGIPGADLSLYPALNTMAEAGGRARPGAVRFYDAGSTAQLEAALRVITAATRGCTYRFSSTPSRPDMVTVQFDGRPVPRNGTDGWIFTDGTNREIRFNGMSCVQLQSGAVRTVNASFNC